MSQTAAAETEAALTAAYESAVAILQAQPKEERGAIIVLSLLDEDMLGKAYGSPEMWVRMLNGVATRNSQFNLALQIVGAAALKGIDLEEV